MSSLSPLADGRTLPGGEVLCGLGSRDAGRVIRTEDGTDRKLNNSRLNAKRV